LKVKILNSFKGKQICKYTQAYLIYILVNFGLCLVPIGISGYVSPEIFLLSSFLAFCYTLLAVTIYTFFFFQNEDVGGTISGNLKKMAGILLMIIYITTFIMYNTVDEISHNLNSNIFITVIIAFIPIFIFSLILSWPVIKQQVASDKPKKLYKMIKQSEDDGDELRNQIGQKGIS